jgi:hypothetical protein
MKLLLLEHLRANSSTQWEEIVQNGIERRIKRKLLPFESQELLELVHELTVSNIIMPAADRSNAGWPWFAVTGHGKALLAASGPPAYDYDGYLADLKSQVPTLDEVVAHYLGESLRAYQFNLFFASMAMLGAASERAMRLLISAYVNSIADDTNQEKLRRRLDGRDISQAYKRFRESFDSSRHQISDATLTREFDAHVDGMFNLVRLARNSIIHPEALPDITGALAYANLQQFAYYSKVVFRLIAHYQREGTVV